MEKEVYKGNIIRVTEETIGGIVWERAYLPNGVIVFPITDEGKVILIKEKRPHEDPPIRIKPVSGVLEHHQGSAAENAQREMQEEIGLRAESLEEFMVLKGSGTINSTQHYFIARNLSQAKLPNPDGEDTIMGTMEFTLDELEKMLYRDELKWSNSTLGIFRLLGILR